MKLIANKTREYKGTQYKKFSVVIPNKVIDKLGWKEGEDLECEVKGDKLVIEKD